MEPLKDVGEIVKSYNDTPLWRIPNFYDLPQECNTIIRSPPLKYKCRDWYMEVYPNGRSLYSSSGWFGIGVFDLNPVSKLHIIELGIRGVPKRHNLITTVEESNGDGFYCCTRFLPRLLLKSWKKHFAPGGDLYVLFLKDHKIYYYMIDTLWIQLSKDDVQKWLKQKFEIANIEPCTQVKEENDKRKKNSIKRLKLQYIHFHVIRKEDVKQNYDDVCAEEPTQVEEGVEMPLETDVGELFIDSDKTYQIKWIIRNFFDLPQEYDTVIRSPCLRFKNIDWYIEVYPNGRRLYSSLGWLGIGVWNSYSGLCNVLVYVLGENPEKNCLFSRADSCGDGSYCCTRLFPTSLLKSWKDVLAARGDLHLGLKIVTGPGRTKNVLRMRVESKYVLELSEQKFVNKDSFIESFTQTEGEIEKEELKQNYDDACSGKSTEAGKRRVEKLRQDFQDILLSGNITDIILKVEGQEFKAHKSILGARSPVFLAMMMHETKEKISGIVDIPDVDAKVFPDFLNYLYTGSEDNLTSENAAKLYTVADKYQVNELKESCKDLMLMNISIDNFCDVFTLSLRHDEKELKEACIQFFTKNSLDIVLTCKWQTFLCENPIIGNELFIKHLKFNK